MPPHKPSPHRFLAARAQPPSSSTAEKTVKGKAQLGLRYGAVPPAAAEGTGQINTPARKRFIIGSALPSPAQQSRPPTSGNRRGEILQNEVEEESRHGLSVKEVDTRAGATRRVAHTPQQRRVRPLKTERIPHDEEGQEQAMQDSKSDVEMVDARNDEGDEATDINQEEMLFESEQPPPTKRPRRTSPHVRQPITSPPPRLPSSSQHHQTPRPHPRPVHTRTHSAHLQTPVSNLNPQRFRPGTTASRTTPHAATTNTTTTRPHFILPPSSPSSPSKSATAAAAAFSNPLPEIFSPSRKRGRFVTDGLAACLQSWLVETADPFGQLDHLSSERNTTEARTRKMKRVRIAGFSENKEREKDDEGGVYARNGGVLFVSAKLLGRPFARSQLPSTALPSNENTNNPSHNPHHDRDVVDPPLGPEKSINLLLSGQGSSVGGGGGGGGSRRKSTAGVRLRTGDVLVLKPPLWEVDLGDGEKWVVCVDWVFDNHARM